MKAIKRLPGNVMRTLGEGLIRGLNELWKDNALWLAAAPALREAQAELMNALKEQDAVAALEMVNAAIREADASHDRLVTIIHMGLETAVIAAEEEGDEEDGRLLRSCMDTLLPDGRSQVKKSWHEEAGQAGILASNMHDVHSERLLRLMTASRPTLEWVRRWVASAERLGRLLTKRGELLATGAAATSLASARRNWGALFSSFLQALPLSGLSVGEQQKIQAPFDEAVRMHRDRVSQRQRSASADDSAVAPPGPLEPVFPDGPMSEHTSKPVNGTSA